MNIMVPLSAVNVLDRFCLAGADEFYMGFYDPEWEAVFGPFEEINRMSSFGSRANFSIQELGNVVEQAHTWGKKAYVTLNSAAYTSGQIKWIQSYTETLLSLSVDGIILGSLELLFHLRSFNVPLVMSTMGGAYNSEIISFYRDLGVSRIILPRDMTLQDMEKIVPRFPDLDFEVFLMRNGCKYSDAHCMSYHSRKYGSMCAMLDSGPCTIETDAAMKAQDIREVYANHTLFTKAFHKSACGLCAVDELLAMGIAAVKIVGRADDPGAVAEDIKRVRLLIDSPGHSRLSCGESCLYGLNCYYTRDMHS